MEFKGFTLDGFQEESIKAIDRGNSCVVSAPTGTGKTLIAEYIIAKHLPQGNTIIYTAPIKALSNQKFKDFKADYGDENVGLLTGDYSINPGAPLLIMTTEVYRNMLVTQDQLIERVAYVIFDEVHYINDRQRGTVWEESIIFSPDHVRFLALSATIPNYDAFAQWIQTIKHHTVETVSYTHRPVPLEHFVFDGKLGLTTLEALQKDMRSEEDYWHAQAVMHPKKKSRRKRKQHSKSKIKPPRHTIVVDELRENVPALYFCFSRAKCEDYAFELSKKHNFVSSKETTTITSYVRKHLTSEIASIPTTKKLRATLAKGIGFHHSGMLPGLKHIVEHLFSEGLIKILYTTETFSVGINMPAKTVVFDSLEKYDGIAMRMLNSKEYFQIAGRAGRRGIDKKGTVVAVVNRQYTNLKKLAEISRKDTDPIISQFKLSVNTVLNLVATYDDATQEKILKSNFDYYTRKQQGKKAVHVMASYKNKIKLLLKLGFIVKSKDGGFVQEGSYRESDANYALTGKGEFARHIYFNEVLLTELFYATPIEKISDMDLLIILAAITYEPRRLDYFVIKGCEPHYKRILKIIRETVLEQELNKINLKRMINFVHAWATGASFKELMKLTNLAEGDIIRFFRRLIDVLEQLQRATTDKKLQERMQALVQRIDRDVVASEI